MKRNPKAAEPPFSPVPCLFGVRVGVRAYSNISSGVSQPIHSPIRVVAISDLFWVGNGVEMVLTPANAITQGQPTREKNG